MRRGSSLAVAGLVAVGCVLPDLDTGRIEPDAGVGGQARAGATGAGGSHAGGVAAATGGTSVGGADSDAQTAGGPSDVAAGAGSSSGGAAGAEGRPVVAAGAAGRPGGAAGAEGRPGGAGGVAHSGVGGTAQGGAAGTIETVEGPCGPQAPSCDGLADCDAAAGSSCCDSLFIEGGTYERSPGESPSYSATVADFCLDKYEVTVGRFRKFLEGYDAWRSAGHPAQDEGEHPLLGVQNGWRTEWSSLLPQNAERFADADRIDPGDRYQTWRDVEGASQAERLPMNYVSWYEAFAFCVWDGGRLPTEAEWQYAAQGGNLNREYPWGNQAPDATRAVYGCSGDGDPDDCSYADILAVGSRTQGNGYWGHCDLGGSLWEWNLDGYDSYADPCNNCANVTEAAYRVTRGGGWGNAAEYLPCSDRYDYLPSHRTPYLGIRCARAAR